MPSAPQWLRDKFPGDDAEAMAVLEKNYIIPKGFIIRPKVAGYRATEREDEAIDYLFHEWDFGYSSEALAPVSDSEVDTGNRVHQ